MENSDLKTHWDVPLLHIIRRTTRLFGWALLAFGVAISAWRIGVGFGIFLDHQGGLDPRLYPILAIYMIMHWALWHSVYISMALADPTYRPDLSSKFDNKAFTGFMSDGPIQSIFGTLMLFLVFLWYAGKLAAKAWPNTEVQTPIAVLVVSLAPAAFFFASLFIATVAYAIGQRKAENEKALIAST